MTKTLQRSRSKLIQPPPSASDSKPQEKSEPAGKTNRHAEAGSEAGAERSADEDIPGKALKDLRRAAGVPNALDSVTVRHRSGGLSTLLFKAYEQGRAKWQGDTLHGVWFDEEPPLDIYTEGLTRTHATGGIVMLTFTPLKGMSEVVRMYLADGQMMEPE